uniref:Phospholipid scramblase n=1 Tax=Glossina austeni TaxID=7395 RepID=A0A1A9UH90_GLOAU
MKQAIPTALAFIGKAKKIYIERLIGLFEAIAKFETATKYEILNERHEIIYYGFDMSSWAYSNTLVVVDLNEQKEIFRMERPFRLKNWCLPCCLQKLIIFYPNGCLIGVVEQKWSLIRTAFRIRSGDGDIVMRVRGPFFTCSCRGDIVFQIDTLQGQKTAEIRKQWPGGVPDDENAQAIFDAEVCGIVFEIPLSVHEKLLILGAAFLIAIFGEIY